jgi:hypothetical protein
MNTLNFKRNGENPCGLGFHAVKATLNGFCHSFLLKVSNMYESITKKSILRGFEYVCIYGSITN